MDSVGRPESHDLGTRFYLDIAEQSVVVFFCPWPQGNGIFPFPIDRDTTKLLPYLVSKLYSNATITRRGMLESHINNSPWSYVNAYFAHCPPVIEPPVNRLAIVDHSSIRLCLTAGTAPIGPQAE